MTTTMPLLVVNCKFRSVAFGKDDPSIDSISGITLKGTRIDAAGGFSRSNLLNHALTVESEMLFRLQEARKLPLSSDRYFS